MGEPARGVVFVKHLVVLFASVMLTMVLGNVLAELIAGLRYFQGQQLDQQLIRLLIRLVSVVIAVVIVIEEMHQIGFSLATLVAGAGVGGLAIALAIQDTLKNIFAGIELALDKPFVVGQRVLMKNYEGDIEEIGLRSTKIRTLTGHQVVIPNQDVARLDVENIGRRPHIRRRFNITVTYDTPPDKIRRAVEILREILFVPETKAPAAEANGQSPDVSAGLEPRQSHPNEAINQPDFPPRVYFSDFNPDSLNILVIYWFHPPDLWQFLEHAHWVNLQIIERFNAEGIDFAFPSQTLYHAGDTKRPLLFGSGGRDSESSGSLPDTPDAPATSGSEAPA
jgi:MscS family membrane protein